MTVIDILPVEAHDYLRLMELSRRTFYDAFEHQNNPDDFAAFAAKAFTVETFQEQLNHPDSRFYYAMIDGAPAGYIKLNYRDAQTEFRDEDALEIERIYVLQQHQGKQIGKQLIDFAIQTALDAGFSYVWLGVWEHNAGAISFYRSQGFEVFSSHAFMVGNDKQTDLLMRKELV
ncbi:GNAT family N-acetyltransferase [Mucilaginibacter pedocola]|uniref:N-acetyltransferase domain-containing protein n=1 Tax=Mucilaginibacter pedocola TaxID=1792845 RepID=A0A1S9PM45_9SPHI|nr:GNAT family N-acetyltransferase [Mucilaginibacter pedocola]OOQ62011.1 hypothetical protein BC343_02865 [Mucilaginibacter pedocola]